jgi:hypothetical protein
MFLWIMCMLFFVFCEKSVEEENVVAVADHGATSAAVSARHEMVMEEWCHQGISRASPAG